MSGSGLKLSTQLHLELGLDSALEPVIVSWCLLATLFVCTKTVQGVCFMHLQLFNDSLVVQHHSWQHIKRIARCWVGAGNSRNLPSSAHQPLHHITGHFCCLAGTV